MAKFAKVETSERNLARYGSVTKKGVFIVVNMVMWKETTKFNSRHWEMNMFSNVLDTARANISAIFFERKDGKNVE